MSLARYCPAVEFSSPGPFTGPKEPETVQLKLKTLRTHHPGKRAICVPGHPGKSVYRPIPYHARNYENEINQAGYLFTYRLKTLVEISSQHRVGSFSFMHRC